MARYVVLRFEDNDAAERYVKFHESTIEVASGSRVVSLVPAPTLFCECTTGKGKSRGFTKGKKYGWWVCVKCKRPTAGWGSSYAAVVGSGTNWLQDATSNTQEPPRGYAQ